MPDSHLLSSAEIEAWLAAHTTDNGERALARFYFQLPLIGRLIFEVARSVSG